MEIDVSKLSSQSNIKADKLFVTVYQTQQLEKPGFKGFAKSLTSFDQKGPFDVLPMHENFVTEFTRKLEIVPEEGDKVAFQNVNGVIEVANNIARVFLEEKK